MIDLLVAGGGPAGLATAICAAEHGMSVVVVEPRQGAIDKACGEGIMPAGRSSLERMGVQISTGRPFLGIQYHQNDATATGTFRGGQGLGIRRTDLSLALWRRADQLGVERRQGRIRDVELHRDSVVAAGEQARWLVGADGLHSAVRESVGISVIPAKGGRYGIRRHFSVEAETDYVDVFLGDQEEAYVTPVGDGLAGIAILSDVPRPFEEGLSSFPALKEQLGVPAGVVKGAGPFNKFASRVSIGRVALVGDAAGFLDPITGEGIRIGFDSAEFLVGCLVRDRLDLYETGWRRIVRRYRWLTGSLLALRRNRYLDAAIVPTLKRMPSMFDRMLELLGGR